MKRELKTKKKGDAEVTSWIIKMGAGLIGTWFLPGREGGQETEAGAI